MGIICLALFIYAWILLIWAVSSWFMMIRGSGGRIAYQVHHLINPIVEPLVRPFRSLLPPVRMGGAGFDLSPIILFVVIQVLAYALC